MRFTQKPGQLPTTMGVLRIAALSASESTTACWPVLGGRTISSSGITCAGLGASK